MLKLSTGYFVQVSMSCGTYCLRSEIFIKLNCENHGKKPTYIETHRKIPRKRYSTRTEGGAHIFMIFGH
jgi:hypothetical protein